MANSPSETWEDGRLVTRNVETNRWSILPDGTAVETDDTEGKAVSSSTVENKAAKTTKATKKS